MISPRRLKVLRYPLAVDLELSMHSVQCKPRLFNLYFVVLADFAYFQRLSLWLLEVLLPFALLGRLFFKYWRHGLGLRVHRAI